MLLLFSILYLLSHHMIYPYTVALPHVFVDVHL